MRVIKGVNGKEVVKSWNYNLVINKEKIKEFVIKVL